MNSPLKTGGMGPNGQQNPPLQPSPHTPTSPQTMYPPGAGGPYSMPSGYMQQGQMPAVSYATQSQPHTTQVRSWEVEFSYQGYLHSQQKWVVAAKYHLHRRLSIFVWWLFAQTWLVKSLRHRLNFMDIFLDGFINDNDLLAPSQPIWLRAVAIPHSVRPSVCPCVCLLTFEVQ